MDEYEKVSVYAKYELNDAEAAALGIEAGMTNMLYTQKGTTMRFEAPAGYKFGKMVFYTYRNSSILVGDEYMEEFEYEYNSSVLIANCQIANTMIFRDANSKRLHNMEFTLQVTKKL